MASIETQDWIESFGTVVKILVPVPITLVSLFITLKLRLPVVEAPKLFSGVRHVLWIAFLAQVVLLARLAINQLDFIWHWMAPATPANNFLAITVIPALSFNASTAIHHMFKTLAQVIFYPQQVTQHAYLVTPYQIASIVSMAPYAAVVLYHSLSTSPLVIFI